MKFAFVAKHRTIWPVAWLCDALGVSRSGFHAWLNRSPSARFRSDEDLGGKVKASFAATTVPMARAGCGAICSPMG
jgi:putative transposase